MANHGPRWVPEQNGEKHENEEKHFVGNFVFRVLFLELPQEVFPPHFVFKVSTGIIYQPGDFLYFKRNDSNQWKGPETVLGRENKQVLVKHDGVYIRIHGCRLVHAQNSQMTSTEENIESKNSGNVESKNEPLDIFDDSDIEINNEIVQVNNVPQIDENNHQKMKI